MHELTETDFAIRSCPRHAIGHSPGKQDWEIFKDWTQRHESVPDIAHRNELCQKCVSDSAMSTTAWVRREFFSDLEVLRVRHSVTLEGLVQRTLEQLAEKWDVRLPEQARKLLLDIRKMWGLDKPPRSERRNVAQQDLVRAAGKTRSQALTDQAGVLLRLAAEIDAGFSESMTEATQPLPTLDPSSMDASTT